MIVTRYCIVLHIILAFNSATAQKVAYSMTSFGITFGKMIVERQQVNDSTDIYTLHAKGYLKVLWMERSDESFYEVKFVNGKLVSSTFRQVESGVVKKWNKLHFNGMESVVESHKGKKALLNDLNFQY
jgi:hypothetical protein